MTDNKPSEPSDDEIYAQQLAHYKSLGDTAGNPSTAGAEKPDA